MNLSGTQLKDTYGNLLTIGTSAGSPQTGTLQNGDGLGITSLTLGGDLIVQGSQSADLFLQDTGATDGVFKLKVNGDIFSVQTSNDSYGFIADVFQIDKGANEANFKIHDGGDISFRDTSTNEAFYWDASEARLGIGTDSPQDLLEVRGADGVTGVIRVQGGKNTVTSIGEVNSRLDFGSNDGSVATPFVGGRIASITEATNGSRTGLAFSTYLQSRSGDDLKEFMRIDHLGKVGIGTQTPANDVSGLHIAVASSSDQLYLERTSSATGRYYLGTASNSFFIVDDAQSAERLRIDSSGNMGIGQTNPSVFSFSSKELHVKGGTGTNESASFIAESAQSASGFLGGYYWVNGSATNEFQKRVGQITVTAGTNADRSQMDFLVKQGAGNYSTAMTIDSSGNVLVGTTSQGYGLFTSSRITLGDGDAGDGFCVGGLIQNNSAYTVQANNDTGTRYFAYIANGSSASVGNISFTSSATSYNTSSDYRLKENVVEMTGALDRVDQLKPSRFNFIADADTTVDGFLAHEVADVVPEAITGEKDAVDDEGNPIYQSIDQSKLVPLLVGAIQELRAEIEQLKNQ
jgi:hypothetical protein